MKHLRIPPNRTGVFHTLLRTSIALAVAAAMLFQAYVCVVQREGDLPLPKGFGNFPENRAVLESAPVKEEFSFAVIGDIGSVGTFERICDHLRKIPLDFTVLVGDGSYGPAEPEHRYLRAELHEYTQPCPFFYVVGNRDVSADRFPLDRFERDYGPSIFSFEYQRCLFIVLRTLEDPFSNTDSLEYLRQFRDLPRDRYRYRFVFMHIPPPMTPLFRQRAVPEGDEFMRAFDEIGVDYVVSGHYHRYAHVRRGSTNYIVTGGGGSNLAKTPSGQFHHALILQVRPDSIEEQLVVVSVHKNLEDILEKIAITELWPMMKRHPIGWMTLDLAGLILIVLLFWRRSIRTP